MDIFDKEVPQDEKLIGTLSSLEVRRMRAEIQRHPEWTGSSIMSNGFTVGQMLRIYQKCLAERAKNRRSEKQKEMLQEDQLTH